MPYHKFPQSTHDKFNAVHKWITSSLIPPDAALESTLASNEAANLDPIDVAPNEGRMLYLFAKMIGAKRILEIGTLGGYSAIWFAKAVGLEGKVITLELDPETAKVARRNVDRAGVGSAVEIMVGDARETLEGMAKQGVEKFDLVFIDADKENNVTYAKRALEFSKPGTLIIFDNVVGSGTVLTDKEPWFQGIRDTFEWLKVEKRLEATAVQTVGPKGWDGFAMARVVDRC